MDEKENVKNFGDMVEAAVKLTRPWRVAFIIANVLWAAVFAAFICLAYLTPDTSYQYQDFDEHYQHQSSGYEVVTPGE